MKYARNLLFSTLAFCQLGLLLAVFPSVPNHGEAAASVMPGLPDSVKKYITENLLPDLENQLDIYLYTTVLEIPPVMRDHISELDWERNQLENFATTKLYLLVDCPDGTTHALMFRDGKLRNNRVLDESRVRVLKRLYSPELFSAPPAPALQTWLDKDEVDAAGLFDQLWWRLYIPSLTELELPAVDFEQAQRNMFADDTNTDALARALGALAESDYAEDAIATALWLISRMDKMSFRRENSDDSIPDLAAVDARQFYENVMYAVRARNEFPWASEVSIEDFCQQVLSPRGTGEPLQRWRRLYFEALEPELRDLTAQQADIAIATANNAYGDFFQYEGDTTWEDFGMLTALAVHEGRCEDCSNVQNSMLRAIGVPAAQAWTPWWGHQDGNHAWTWIRGIQDPPGDGRNGVKVFLKTWEGPVDVTAEYTPVTNIETDTMAADGIAAELMVWNSGEWRKITTAESQGDAVVFRDVGCRLNQTLCIRIPDEADRVADLRSDGSYSWLNLAPAADETESQFTVNYDKTTPLGEMSPEEDYELLFYTTEGWLTAPSERLATGGFTFAASADRLYRISGPGVANRPFTVEPDPETGDVVTLKR